MPETAKRILDVGCGAGGLVRALARPGRWVTGIDLSPGMIHLAHQHSKSVPGVSFQVADCMTWSPGHNRYDAIVSVTTLHHLELEPAIARLASWLEPGGRMIIVDLWRIAGPIDVAITLLAAPISRIRRLSQAARARSGRALWRAWDRHGATDRYLSMAEVRATFARLLPGCRVRRHLAWRYSVVWDKA